MMTARETPGRRRVARQSRQAERGGARRISSPKATWPGSAAWTRRLALRRAHLVPVGRRRVLHHPARPLGVGQVHGRRRPRFDLDRLARSPVRQGPDAGKAELIEEPNVGGHWVEIANEMSLRYLGENGPKYLVPTLNEPRWLFFVKPKKIYSWQGTDWAKPLQAQRMGNVGDRATSSPGDRVESFPGDRSCAGFAGGDGPDAPPARTNPAPTSMPGRHCRGPSRASSPVETVAVDLPGHGLSDDPWDPERLPDLLELCLRSHRRPDADS